MVMSIINCYSVTFVIYLKRKKKVEEVVEEVVVEWVEGRINARAAQEKSIHARAAEMLGKQDVVFKKV